MQKIVYCVEKKQGFICHISINYTTFATEL